MHYGPWKNTPEAVADLRVRFRRGDKFADIQRDTGFQWRMADHYATPKDWVERELNVAKRRIEKLMKKYPNDLRGLNVVMEATNGRTESEAAA